jgi:Chromate transporter
VFHTLSCALDFLPALRPNFSASVESSVFTTFWPLGLVAFGGPAAHVAILRDRLVDKGNWLDEESFTELFAIGQGLPGATSTQLVVSAALFRAGPLGGILALVLWLFPGFIVLTICGALFATFVDPENPPCVPQHEFLIGTFRFLKASNEASHHLSLLSYYYKVGG